MNRRSFLGALLGFAVLPGATTYKRIWKATEAGVLVPTTPVPNDIMEFENPGANYFELKTSAQAMRSTLTLRS